MEKERCIMTDNELPWAYDIELLHLYLSDEQLTAFREDVCAAIRKWYAKADADDYLGEDGEITVAYEVLVSHRLAGLIPGDVDSQTRVLRHLINWALIDKHELL
jgi:hypothetical protein